MCHCNCGKRVAPFANSWQVGAQPPSKLVLCSGQNAASRTDARTIATSHLATEGGQYYFSSQSSLGHSCAHGAMSNRVCPGRWFATEAVWAAIVSILASDIVSSMDEQGKPKPVIIDCTAGAVSFVSFLQLVSTVSSMDEMLTVASM